MSGPRFDRPPPTASTPRHSRTAAAVWLFAVSTALVAHSAHGFSPKKAFDAVIEFVVDKTNLATEYTAGKVNKGIDFVEDQVQPTMEQVYYKKGGINVIKNINRVETWGTYAYNCAMETRSTGQACTKETFWVVSTEAAHIGATAAAKKVLGSQSVSRAPMTVLAKWTRVSYPTLSRLAASAAPKLIHPVAIAVTTYQVGDLARRVIIDSHFRSKSQEHQDRFQSETALMRNNCDVAITYGSLLRNKDQAAANDYLNRVRADPGQHAGRPCGDNDPTPADSIASSEETADEESAEPDESQQNAAYRIASREEIDEDRAARRELDAERYRRGVDQATNAVAETNDRGRELARLERDARRERDLAQRQTVFPNAAPSVRGGPTASNPGMDPQDHLTCLDDPLFDDLVERGHVLDGELIRIVTSADSETIHEAMAMVEDKERAFFENVLSPLQDCFDSLDLDGSPELDASGIWERVPAPLTDYPLSDATPSDVDGAKCDAGYDQFSPRDGEIVCLHASVIEPNCSPGSMPVEFDLGLDKPICRYKTLDYISQGECRENYAKVQFGGRTTCRWAQLQVSESVAYALDPRTGKRSVLIP